MIFRAAAILILFLLTCTCAVRAEDKTEVREIEGPRDMNLFNVEPTVLDESKWEAPMMEKCSFYYSYDIYLERGH